MSQDPPEGSVAEEFEKLGQNIKEVVRQAWNSEASQKLRQDISAGLAAVDANLKEAAQELRSQEAAERFRTGVDDIGERVRSGQVEADLRAGLLSLLKSVNAELAKARRPGPENHDTE
jgi:hypothetical protein